MSARRRPFGVAAEPVGYLVGGSRTAYFAGDTDLFPGMSDLRGRVDVALLPVWGWGPSVGGGASGSRAGGSGGCGDRAAGGDPDPLGDARASLVAAPRPR